MRVRRLKMQIWCVGPILYNMGGSHSKGKKYHHRICLLFWNRCKKLERPGPYVGYDEREETKWKPGKTIDIFDIIILLRACPVVLHLVTHTKMTDPKICHSLRDIHTLVETKLITFCRSLELLNKYKFLYVTKLHLWTGLSIKLLSIIQWNMTPFTKINWN